MKLIRHFILLGIGMMQTCIQNLAAQDFGGPTQSQIEEAQEFYRNLRPLLDQVRMKNKLKYGEPCDYPLEESRQQLGKSFVTSLPSPSANQPPLGVNPVEVNQRVLQNFQSLASLRGSFCSVFDNLLCNSSSRCDCATADYDHGIRIQFVREEDTCVLAPGSTCPAQHQHPDQSEQGNLYSNPLQSQEAKCAAAAPCKLKSNGKFCSLKNAQAAISAIMDSAESENPEERPEFVRRKLQEGICTCGGIPLIATSGILFLISTVAFLLS